MFLQMGIRVSFQLLTLSANGVGKATSSYANAKAVINEYVMEPLGIER